MKKFKKKTTPALHKIIQHHSIIIHSQSRLILTILLCNLGNDFVELREKK